MNYVSHYHSPLLGEILLSADDVGLTGLWFAEQKHYAAGLNGAYREEETPALAAARLWLDRYLAGQQPDFTPPLHLVGTPFQLAVWQILCQIPYGQLTTYGQIARAIAREQNKRTLSAQAVGGAVGRNKIGIIVPCHRVIGAGGNLTGYAGGLDKKIKLLALESIDTQSLFVPTKGTAL